MLEQNLPDKDSPLDIDAIEARANAATSGPWLFQSMGGCNTECPEPPEWWATAPDGTIIAADHYPGNGHDVAFIAHARQDIPALIAEVRRLERMALDDDNYRCESCERVFRYDEIIHGEDCYLCVNCAKEIAAEYA